MKKLILLTVCGLTMSSAAFAQGWDYDRDRGYGDRSYGDRGYRERSYRDEDRGERAAREIFRGVTGQGRECRVVTRRERDRDGDVIVSRRRICD